MLIRLNKKFYSEEAIQSAITAFNQVMDTDIEKDDDDFILLIEPKTKLDEKRLEGEFCNYCLSMMK